MGWSGDSGEKVMKKDVVEGNVGNPMNKFES